MIQAIYPIVVAAYKIFQYGKSESAGAQHYLGVADKVSCESGGGESGGCSGQPGGVVVEQSFQYGGGESSGY
jgi:hypothetical protein